VTDPPVTLERVIRRNVPHDKRLHAYNRRAAPTRDWPDRHGPSTAETTFSLNRMKILKKSLPSEKLSTTLARLDRQNMFEEIR
jgi:hypothetical protein